MAAPVERPVEGARRGLRAPSASRGRVLGERGAVTAETAVVLPALVLMALVLVWVVSLAATQVRVVDAAREVARAAARDESSDAAVARGRHVAPEGASIHLSTDGSSVVATVEAEAAGPGGLLAFLPAVRVSSEAVAAREQQ